MGGPFTRLPPSQVIEKQTSNFAMLFLLPVCMALAISIATMLAWCACVYAIKILGLGVWYLTSGLCAAGNIVWVVMMVRKHGLDLKRGWYSLILCAFVTLFSIAVARVVGFSTVEAMSLVWVIGALSFVAWLTIAFGLELIQRSPAMEEHGYFGLFDWLFGFKLRQEKQARSPVSVGSRSLPPIQTSSATNGKPRLFSMRSTEPVEDDEITVFNTFLEMFLTHSIACGEMVDDEGNSLDLRGALARDVLCGHPMPDGSRLKQRNSNARGRPGWRECIDYLESVGYVIKDGIGYTWATGKSALLALNELEA